MLPRYMPHFTALSVDQAHLVAAALRLVDADDTESSITGTDLFHRCEAAELDQADVIMSLAADPSPAAVATVACLLGRPIDVRRRGESAYDAATGRLIDTAQPEGSAPRRTGNARSSAAQPRTDPRVVVSVAPNPKKPGSGSHTRYAHWAIGRTVTECMTAGLTTADVRYDLDRGYVVVAAPGTATSASEDSQS